MKTHRLVVGGARHQVIAALVLVATSLACFWLATYTDSSFPGGKIGVILPVGRYTPDWAVALAVAIGLVGAAVALLIYRPHANRR